MTSRNAHAFDGLALASAFEITWMGAGPAAAASLPRRQRPEQYLISSQARSHFLRQVNGRPQVMHILLGIVVGVKRRTILPLMIASRAPIGLPKGTTRGWIEWAPGQVPFALWPNGPGRG